MRCMTEKINSFDFYVPMDIPLVLEGGAMRGVFEAGVLDVFIEKGLRFRKVVGTSAGAMQGMCYMSGQKDAISESIRLIVMIRGTWE